MTLSTSCCLLQRCAYSPTAVVRPGLSCCLHGLSALRLLTPSRLMYLRRYIPAHREKKHHVRYTTAILVTSVVLFPVVLATIALSAFLSAPLIPMFGLPIFVVGYPRPKRFWPDPAGTRHGPSEDTVYYQHAAGAAKDFFARALAVRSVGAVAPGAHFLARFQNRFVWVHVVEVRAPHSPVAPPSCPLHTRVLTFSSNCILRNRLATTMFAWR
jgi:hypothetical protein